MGLEKTITFSVPVITPIKRGLSQRGRGTLRRSPEDGTTPLQELRQKDAGELEQRVIFLEML